MTFGIPNTYDGMLRVVYKQPYPLSCEDGKIIFDKPSK